MLYSIAGWIIETLLFLIRDKKVVKRGFLFGPVCPIYGSGAVLCTAVLYGRVNNIFLVFIFGLLLCGGLEYITHFLMEKFFHAMWWDYSSRRFNIKGRVYLNGLLEFGFGAVLIVKVIQPLVFKLIGIMPPNVLYIICFILYSFLVFDLATTISDLKDSVKFLKLMQSEIIDVTQKGVDQGEVLLEKRKDNLKESELNKKLTEYIKNDTVIKRIKEKYPNFTIEKYKHILEIITDKPQEEKARKDIKLYGTAESKPNPEDKA
jgi:uncharacterized membrane protein